MYIVLPENPDRLGTHHHGLGSVLETPPQIPLVFEFTANLFSRLPLRQTIRCQLLSSSITHPPATKQTNAAEIAQRPARPPPPRPIPFCRFPVAISRRTPFPHDAQIFSDPNIRQRLCRSHPPVSRPRQTSLPCCNSRCSRMHRLSDSALMNAEFSPVSSRGEIPEVCAGRFWNPYRSHTHFTSRRHLNHVARSLAHNAAFQRST